jgi:1-acyl-sn-glycerol-3-phosphate acyltransferase
VNVTRNIRLAIRHVCGAAIAFGLGYTAYGLFRICGGSTCDKRRLGEYARNGGILVANHTSYLDWILLAGLIRYECGIWPVFLAKDRLFRHPLFGPAVNFVKCIRVADDASKIVSDVDLSNANCLAIFPEGSRSRTGRIGHCHTGAVRIAARYERKVFPVALKGFYEVWPSQRWLPRLGRCQILCGTPRYVTWPEEGEACRTHFEAETYLIMNEIAQLLDGQLDGQHFTANSPGTSGGVSHRFENGQSC